MSKTGFKTISRLPAIVLLLSTVSTATLAQHYVGVKNALGLNNLSVSPRFETENYVTPFNPGLVYRYDNTGNTAVQAELNRITKGYIRKADTVVMPFETTDKISSWQFSLTTQLFLRAGIFRPYVTGGGVLGYITDREIKVENDDFAAYQYGDNDRRFVYGIAGGAGVGVTVFERFEIQGEWRFHYDFSYLRDPIIPSNDGTGRNVVSSQNTTQMMISVSLMYRLSKNKKTNTR